MARKKPQISTVIRMGAAHADITCRNMATGEVAVDTLDTLRYFGPYKGPLLVREPVARALSSTLCGLHGILGVKRKAKPKKKPRARKADAEPVGYAGTVADAVGMSGYLTKEHMAEAFA